MISSEDRHHPFRRDFEDIKDESILLGKKVGIIKLKNGSEVTFIGGYSSEGNSRSTRSNFYTFKDENGDIVEMDMRDNSYRVVYTAEDLEED